MRGVFFIMSATPSPFLLTTAFRDCICCSKSFCAAQVERARVLHITNTTNRWDLPQPVTQIIVIPIHSYPITCKKDLCYPPKRSLLKERGKRAFCSCSAFCFALFKTVNSFLLDSIASDLHMTH